MNLQNLLNLAHLHLLLNHWPIIGTFIGLGLFLVSLAAKGDDLKKASLVVFSIIALFAIPTYTSGNAAYEVIRRETGVTKTIIDAHQGAALMSLLFMEITGFFSWLGLWQYRRFKRTATYILPAVLLCRDLDDGSYLGIGPSVMACNICAETIGSAAIGCIRFQV